METRVCLRHIMNGYLWKEFLASNLPPTPPNLICLTIFVALRPFTQFNLKLDQLIFKNALKVILLHNYFYHLFTEVQIWSWKPFKFGVGRIFSTNFITFRKFMVEQTFLLSQVKRSVIVSNKLVHTSYLTSFQAT